MTFHALNKPGRAGDFSTKVGKRESASEYQAVVTNDECRMTNVDLSIVDANEKWPSQP